jgi:hypothetical protein
MISASRQTWRAVLVAACLVAFPRFTEAVMASPCGGLDVTADPCLLICPNSDVVYKVTVKDALGNPTCVAPSLWLDFSNCPAIPCPGEEPAWPRVFPDSCNAQGEHFFTVDAGMQFCTVCQPALVLNGVTCQFLMAHFLDVTGDLCVTATDFTNQICNDYNCDGLVNAVDFGIFSTHMGHCCPTTGPCQSNGLPFCDSVTTDPCLLICPRSDEVFKVVVKDSCGNPVCATAALGGVWLDFTGCPAEPCPNEEPNWPRVLPDSCDPLTGTHYFTVDASMMQCTQCDAALFVRGAFCRAIPAHFFDTNGDRCVTPADFAAGAVCNDYNCNGVFDPNDQVIFQTHLNHCCQPTGPCQPGRPYCDSVIAPPCMQVCPWSDVLYTILVKDSCGNPYCQPGAPAPEVWLEFANCAAEPCPNEEPFWPRVYPDSCDALGQHFFHVDASAFSCNDCVAILYIRGVPCKTIQVKFLDTNGDRCVTPADFVAGALCNDYNCDGVVDAVDRTFFNSHLCHCCTGFCLVHITGDINNNGVITSADIIELVNYVFKGGPAPRPCPAAGDVNCDGVVNSSDIIRLVNYVFKGGIPPCDVCTIIPSKWICCPFGP